MRRGDGHGLHRGAAGRVIDTSPVRIDPRIPRVPDPAIQVPPVRSWVRPEPRPPAARTFGPRPRKLLPRIRPRRAHAIETEPRRRRPTPSRVPVDPQLARSKRDTTHRLRQRQKLRPTHPLLRKRHGGRNPRNSGRCDQR
ncbi:hypothetical protein BJ991_000025 [Microbacterium immunditiarum]|uniref:Uncharacterized protein n=1 Tax=Microbacterium immunditiarum TaxID=337480 RepID=A0A7Y9GK86_9MICO|nr:hypothetical protein [Microbacterium immunditiarum]